MEVVTDLGAAVTEGYDPEVRYGFLIPDTGDIDWDRDPRAANQESIDRMDGARLTVTVTPRNYKIPFRYMGEMESHYAMIGMAYVAEDYPLYYDAVNEKGVGMAGLNFVGNAVYQEVDEAEDGKENVCQYELIPWILSQCASVREVRELLSRMNLVGTPFSEQLPAAQLHWIIADEKEATF